MLCRSLHEVSNVWQQSEVAGTLYGLSHTTLELEGSACDAAGQDLALLVKELLEELRILIVDILDAGTLEAAVFLLLGIYGERSKITYFAVVLCHDA